jgi:S-formylglutathione hydrolase
MTSGKWSRIQIAGKPADIYEPGHPRPRFGLIHLHDQNLETLFGRESFSRFFDELGLACVCPVAGPCWWAARICPAFDERTTPEQYVLREALPYFDRSWGLEPPAVAIEGIGMGGQGALRIAFKHPNLFRVVASISGALDCHELYGRGTELDRMYPSKEHCRQDTALMHIPPVDYPPHIFFCIDADDALWFRGNDRMHEKLSALGIAHQFDLSTRAGGHSWHYFDAVAEPVLRFIHTGLLQESRRLL